MGYLSVYRNHLQSAVEDGVFRIQQTWKHLKYRNKPQPSAVAFWQIQQKLLFKSYMLNENYLR